MKSVTAILAAMLVLSVIAVNGQISTPCTSAQVASFTPCIGFIIGSANGGSPSAGCCKAMESLTTSSMACTCLIVTGNIPFSLPSPINQALAISLPQACNTNIPIQCNASAVALPPAGPALFVPPPPKRPPPRVLPPLADSPDLPPSPSGLVTSALAPAPTPSENNPEEVPDTRDVPDATASAPIVRPSPKTGSGIRPVLTPASDSNLLMISPGVLLVLLVSTAISNFR